MFAQRIACVYGRVPPPFQNKLHSNFNQIDIIPFWESVLLKLVVVEVVVGVMVVGQGVLLPAHLYNHN